MDFTSKKCSCERSKEIDAIALKSILPGQYKYAQCDFKDTNGGQFVCRFRINLFTKEDATSWLEEFMVSSKMTFKKAKTFPENSQRNVYKVVLRCHHNTCPSRHTKNPHAKHTNCKARMILTVKQQLNTEKYRGKDIHLLEFPTNVILCSTHNHSIDSGAVLKYRNPTEDVKEIFLKMFQAGYTPSKAYNEYTADVQEEHGDYFYLVASDRAICPNLQWVYYLYYKVYKKGCTEAIDKGVVTLSENDLEKEETSVPTQQDFMEHSDEDVPTIDTWEENDQCEQEQSEREKEILKNLGKVFHALEEKVTGNPYLLDAAEAFVMNFAKINSENALASALHAFNRYRGLGIRKKITTSKNIGGQSTARRKALYGGQLALQCMQSPKLSLPSEIDYCHQMQQSSLLPEKKSKTSAPYNT